MVQAQPNTSPGEWDTQTPLGFWHTNGSPNLGQTVGPYNSQQQQKINRTCRIEDFAVLADHKVKLKENKDKYLDIAKELKKLWNIKVTFISIVIGILSIPTEGLKKELGHLKILGRVETIQTIALLRSARILRRVLETWGNLPSFKLQLKYHLR